MDAFDVRRRVAVVRNAYLAWSADRAPRLGAALAYYSLFALVPVVLLAISLAGLLFGRDVADSTVEEGIADLVGPEIAAALAAAIDRMRADSVQATLPIISVGVLVFAATVLFVAWQEIVNLLWHVPHERGFRASLRRRLFGVIVIVGAGLLLALVIFAETVLGALDRRLEMPFLDAVVRVSGSAVPFVLGIVFLVVLFTVTPEADVAWRRTVVPALLSMSMLWIGAFFYGLYLGTVGFANASGVAGSLLLGLALVYYAAQILLFGVELTRAAHDEAAVPRASAP